MLLQLTVLQFSPSGDQERQRLGHLVAINIVTVLSPYAEESLPADLHVLPAHCIRVSRPEPRRDELHCHSYGPRSTIEEETRRSTSWSSNQFEITVRDLSH